MIHWQYPPRQWPRVKSLTMVRKVAFGVGFGVSFSNFSACCMIFAGTDCLRFYKEKKYIRLNVCFA